VVEEEEPETTVPVDTDGDGVVDTLDACPNTPTGTAVGATGCPVTTGNGTTGAVVAPVSRRFSLVS